MDDKKNKNVSDTFLNATQDMQDEDTDMTDAAMGVSGVHDHNVREATSDSGEGEAVLMNQDDKAGKAGNQVDLRDYTGNDTINENTPPDVMGEQSVSGSDPDPGADDDVLLNAQDVGIALDEDPEHPQELDIAGDIDQAEEYHRRQ